MKGAKNIKYKYKKNGKDNKFYLSVAVMTAVFAAILKLLTTTASTSTIPTLFINDLPFEYYEKYPLVTVDGFVCVPLMYIAEMPGVVDLSRGDALCLQYQNYHYISFGDKDGLAIDMESDQRGIEFYCPVYTIGGVKYVRAETVCNSLRITYEYEKHNGVSVWRIKDRTARKSFESLISRYIDEPPTPPRIETTTESPVQPPTNPPIEIPRETTGPREQETTAEPTTAENTREIENYFIFNGIGRNYGERGGGMQPETEVAAATEYEEQTENEFQAETGRFEGETSNYSGDGPDSPGIYGETVGEDNTNVEYFLDALKRENITAVFFFTGSEILRNPTGLRQAYAMGHEIGIEIEGGKVNPSPEDLILELEKVNALIYTLTKCKTRFYMLDENMYENNGVPEVSEELKFSSAEALTAAGYCRIIETFSVSDSEETRYIYELYADGDEDRAVSEMTEFLKREELNIIKFDMSGSGAENEANMNEDYENYLDLAIKAINGKFYISAKKATVPFFISVNPGVSPKADLE